MTPSNLQDVLDQATNTVEHAAQLQIGAYIYPVVPYEFSNWRHEQRAWQETAVLFDQSHHMVNLFLRGPGAIELITATGINSIANFPVNMAKQFVPCTPAGNVIGDGILFHLADEEFVWVGRAPAANWLRYQAETGDYKVDVEYDDRSPGAPVRQGGHAQVLALPDPGPERVVGDREGQRRTGRAAEVLPHGGDERRRRDRPHPAPRHGRRARPGAVGSVRDLRQGPRGDPRGRPGVRPGRRCGARAYASNTLESGWIPSPLPAIYTGEELRGYREWLPAASYEANNALAGSFVSDDIEDYYPTRGSSATGRS